jgi:hypothetical protein
MSGNRTENLCGGASADYACCASAGTTREMSACAEKAGQGRAGPLIFVRREKLKLERAPFFCVQSEFIGTDSRRWEMRGSHVDAKPRSRVRLSIYCQIASRGRGKAQAASRRSAPLPPTWPAIVPSLHPYIARPYRAL